MKKHNANNNASICVEYMVLEGGKLLLFDSLLVDHNILPTCKERLAVVGWFLSKEGAVRRGGVGGDGGIKRSHQSPGEE